MPSQTVGLGIEISAEVARAVANLRNVNDEFERMGDDAKKALQEAGNALDDLSKGTVSINRLTKALEVFRTASRNAMDVESLEQYNRSIQQIENELNRLNNVGRQTRNGLTQLGAVEASSAFVDLGRVASDLPFGFIAIQNNLDPLINSFGRTFAAAGGLSAGLRALGSALLGPAGLGFAFSSISSLVTVAIQKYGSLGAAIDALFTTTTAAQRAQKLFNDTLLDGEINAQKNIVQLDNLYAATQNLNVPLKDRNIIADELQKMYPSIFGNLSNEAILAGQAAGAYSNLKDQLIAVATAEAFRDEQVKQAQDLIKLQSEEKRIRGEQLKAVRDLQKAQEQLNDSQVLSVGAATNTQQYSAAIVAANANIAKWTTLLRENAIAQGDVIDIQKDLSNQQKALSEQFGASALLISTDKAKTTKKNVKTVAEIVKELTEELTALDTRFGVMGGSLRDLTEDRLKSFADALSQLRVIGVGQGNAVFDNIQKDITSLQNVLSTPQVPKIPLVIEPIPQVNNAATVALLKKNLEGFEGPLNDFTKRINTIIQSALVDGVSSIFEGIGEGIVSGNFSGILKGFANTLSTYLSQLGKTLIAQGLAIEAFKKSLESLQGIPAIVAGGALIAASAAFKALAGKGPQKYATGGFAMGPQLAVIGDNPGRKEMIVPSEDFDKLGGFGSDFVLTHTLKGQDILLAIRRAGKELNRFN